jgi:hypothetical protein
MKIKHVEVKQFFTLHVTSASPFRFSFSYHLCNLLKGKSNWWSDSTTTPQNLVTQNIEGENPLDVPNI